MPNLTVDIIKIFILAIVTNVLALLWTPFLTNFLYKYKLWKKEARNKTITGEEAPVFYQLHKKRETKAPRFGGLLIWVTVLFVIYFFYFLSKITDSYWIENLNFLSRGQTWLPLFTLVVASIVGFFDDILQVSGAGRYIGGGMSLKKRLLIVIGVYYLASIY